MKIDPETASTAETFTVGRGPSGIAVGAAAVWVAYSGDGTVSRVDSPSGKTTAIELGSAPGGIVAAYGAVWTAPASLAPELYLRVAAAYDRPKRTWRSRLVLCRCTRRWCGLLDDRRPAGTGQKRGGTLRIGSIARPRDGRPSARLHDPRDG